MQRRIKRALLYPENVVSGLLDPSRDCVAVRRAPTHGLKDEKV
jgi:hypothetical protein